MQKLFKNIDIISVVLVGAILRFPGILHGLPTYVMPSEYEIIATAIKCLRGNLNNEFIFYYGGFYYYVNAVLIILINVIYHSLHFIGLVKNASTPYWLFYAGSRGMNVIFNLIMVMAVYGIACRLRNRKGGIFAAVIIAIAPFPLIYSIRICPDILCITMATVSIYFSVRHLTEKKDKWLWYAVLFSGLAIGSKYMFLSVIPFCTAKYINDRRNKTRFFDIRLLKAFFLVALTFIFTTPSSVLYLREFIFNGLLFVHADYSGGIHPWNETFGIALFFIRDLFLNGVTPGIFIISITGMILFGIKSIYELLVIALGPLLWTILMSAYRIPNTYNIMIILVPMVVCAGMIIDKIKLRNLGYILLVLVCIQPLLKDIQYLRDYMKKDIRYVAQEWINKNLPAGSWIAREDYTPFFDCRKFKCTYIGICGLAYMSPDSVRKAGYDYVISASHDRFLWYPKKYAQEIENYNNVLHEFEIIKEFDPCQKYRGSKIQILRLIRDSNMQ